MSRFYYLWFLQLLLILAVSGCGTKHPDLVPVTGTVTIDGQPVTFGQVKLSPQGKRAAVGRIGEDGRFTLSSFKLNDGVPVGTHLATVVAVESINEHSNRWHAPKKYANQSQANLSVSIEGPTNDLKIELTWAGSKHTAPFVDKF